MAPDDVTLRHLSHQRVRGAPATIPGAAGFVPEYTAGEVLRPTQRSLVCALPPEITLAALRTAFGRLEEVARAQKLKIAGEPLFAVTADPMIVVPNQRAYEACLPVRGEAKEDGDVRPSRVEGGYHITSTTSAGLDDIENVYTWLFGKFLPARKHQLTRPYILHRVVSGLDPASTTSAVIEVEVPATLSIKPTRGASGGEEAT
jgi:DNA gyrase inhibitor GyrI